MGYYQQQRKYRFLRQADHLRVAILGSGLAGRLANALIPNSVILTKRRDEIKLGHVFIHDRAETRMLLRFLSDIPFKTVEIPFWYYNHRTGEMSMEITAEERIQLVREKMGIKDDAVDTGDLSISTKNDLMNDRFFHLDFDEKQFLKKLNASSDMVVEIDFRMIQERPDGVDIFIGEEMKPLTFDYVINTIPRNAFEIMHSSGLPQSIGFASMPVSFVTTKDHAIEELAHIRDHMLYAFGGCNWKRIICKRGVSSIEYNNTVTDEIIKHDFRRIKDYQINTIPYARIISRETPDTDRIIHVGRFAEWNHRVSTEHVINKLIMLNI